MQHNLSLVSLGHQTIPYHTVQHTHHTHVVILGHVHGAGGGCRRRRSLGSGGLSGGLSGGRGLRLLVIRLLLLLLLGLLLWWLLLGRGLSLCRGGLLGSRRSWCRLRRRLVWDGLRVSRLRHRAGRCTAKSQRRRERKKSNIRPHSDQASLPCFPLDKWAIIPQGRVSKKHNSMQQARKPSTLVVHLPSKKQ